MELLAAGFNAWNQLNFRDSQPDEPDDVYVFETIFETDEIRSLEAHLTCTIGP